MKSFFVFLLLGIVLTKALTSSAKSTNRDLSALEGIMNQMERNGEAAESNEPEGAVVLEEEEPSSQTQVETKDVSANLYRHHRYCRYVYTNHYTCRSCSRRRTRRCYYG